MIQLPAVQIHKTGPTVYFDVPPALDGMVSAFIGSLKGWAGLTLSRPKKPRTTGEKSQNTHIAGHETQISDATGCSFEAVRMRMKQLCPGWPHEILPDGSSWPMSESDATTEQAAKLIDTIHAFAAEYGIILYEGENDA